MFLFPKTQLYLQHKFRLILNSEGSLFMKGGTEFWIVVFILIFLGGKRGIAQSENIVVKGQIVDETGDSLMGVNVFIKGTSNGVLTDENGNYNLNGQFSGQHTLVASYVGFNDFSKKYNFSSGAEYNENITLKDGYSLDQITISAKSKIQKIEALPYNVDVVDASKLHKTTMDVGNTLDKVSGIRVRQKGGVGSKMKLSMNGFRGNQVKLFIDGVSMENFGNAFQINNIPINVAERLEVYKGVVPVGLGADALGGAINIVTNSYDENRLEMSYSYGSFNTHKTNISANYVSDSDFVINLQAFQNFSANNYDVDVDVADLNTGEYYPNRSVERFHDKYHNETVIAKFGVINKSYADELFVGGTFAQSYNEIQTGARINAVYGGRLAKSYTIMPSLRYLKKDLIVDGLDVKLNANYNLGKDQVIDTLNRRYNWSGDFVEYENPGGELRYTNLELKNNNGVVNASINYEIDENQSISLSNNYNTFDRKRHNLLDTDNEIYEQPQKTFKNVAGLGYTFENGDWNLTGFVKNYNQVNKFDLAYNPSGDYGDVAYRFKRNTFNDFGYGAAGTYFFNDDFQIKASFEKSFRLPEPDELFGDGGILIEGNNSLEPEKSYNYNLGLGYGFNLNDRQRINLDATVYYRDSKGFIRPRLNTNQVLQTYDNLEDVTNLGFEAQVDYNYDNKFKAGFNLTYQDLRNNTKYRKGEDTKNIVYDDRIPNIPFLYGNANASYRFDDVLQKGDDLTLQYDLLYVHPFYLYWPSLGGDDKYEIPEQFIQGIRASYSIEHFDFIFECRNIFDKKRFDDFSLQKPGRNFSGKIRYTL